VLERVGTAYAARVLIAFIGLALCAGGKQPLGPKEIVARIEASPRKYDIREPESPVPQWLQQNAMVMWPQLRPPLDVVMRDGKDVVAGRQPPVELLRGIEQAFAEKRYMDAEKGYARVLAKFPGDYVITLAWGDAAYFDSRTVVALGRYEAATKLAPLDLHGWWYRANALLALGRKKEAIDSYVKALVLRPRHVPLLNSLESRVDAIGLRVAEPIFLPQARVGISGDDVVVTVLASPHWLAWGLCKALWLGEPSFRKEQTGTEEHRFSIEEERMCLANLLATYLARSKGEPIDPAVERVLAVQKAGLLDALIVHELASRGFENVAATLEDKGRAALEAYVRKFVLVPK